MYLLFTTIVSHFHYALIINLVNYLKVLQKNNIWQFSFFQQVLMLYVFCHLQVALTQDLYSSIFHKYKFPSCIYFSIFMYLPLTDIISYINYTLIMDKEYYLSISLFQTGVNLVYPLSSASCFDGRFVLFPFS